MILTSLADLQALKETVVIECKLAAGLDGKGKLPRDFWPTYSAFANTHGGIIVLGIEEKDGVFTVKGVASPDKLLKELFNNANNPQKVSVNLLSDDSVRQIIAPEGVVLAVYVPPAQRRQKPVYLNGNPMSGNTYRRLHEGDRHCDDETVRRMLAEQVEESRDNQILLGFDLTDIALDSLHAYRNMFISHKPDHPWNSLDDGAFMRALGGWREDRMQKTAGLTLAGALMFGQWTTITQACPNYFVDYQEQSADISETRWLDRVVPDGSWSGNLFDFYRKVMPKLVADLKVPFVLKDHIRQDETPLHTALREALINTLVHADFSDRASLQIIKKPQGFLFRNPGLMRVPAEIALHGGESDCRNRTLHQMFLMVGLGERAGSGLPKIVRGWQAVNGSLSLSDTFVPYDQTRLEMNWILEEGTEKISEKTTEKISGKTIGKTTEKNVSKSTEKTTEKNSPKSTEKTEALILAQLTLYPQITIAELSKKIHRSTSTIEKQLNKLKSTGRVLRVGADKGGHWEVLK